MLAITPYPYEGLPALRAWYLIWIPLECDRMTKLIIYSKEKNPHCEKLKDALKKLGIPYHEIDIRNPEAITELRKNGCFILEPPVLQVVQDKSSQWFFKNNDLFRGGRLIQEAMRDVMRISRPQTSWPY